MFGWNSGLTLNILQLLLVLKQCADPTGSSRAMLIRVCLYVLVSTTTFHFFLLPLSILLYQLADLVQFFF